MNKEEYINSVVSHIKNKRNRQLISKEISDHIDDETEFYVSKGYDYDTACEKAVASMGSSELVGVQLGKIHSRFLDKIIAFVLFAVYAVIVSQMLNILFILVNSSELSIFSILFEFVFFTISILSILLANKFKSRLILLVSLIFTVIYYFSRLFCLFISVTYFSPLLTVDYFVFTFRLDDFAAINNEVASPSNILIPLFSFVFYCAWFSAYVLAFTNIKKFVNCTYDFKSVNKERKLNSILIVVLLIHLFTVSISSYAVMPNKIEDLFGDAPPYYEGVMIMESDTQCDMEVLHKEKYYSSEYYYPNDNLLLIDYNEYSTDAIIIWREKNNFDDYDVLIELKPFGNGFSYETKILYTGYKADKKYITAVPLHYDTKGQYVPDFSKAKWYETAVTEEITGILDTDELKSHFYKIDIINTNE